MATKNRKKFNEAIAALLSTKNTKQAAAKCHIRYGTLVYWLRHDQEFIALYKEETASLLEDVKNSLRQLAIPALEVTRDGLLDEMQSPLERFPIAKFTLETVLNLELSEAALKTIKEPSKKPANAEEFISIAPQGNKHKEDN